MSRSYGIPKLGAVSRERRSMIGAVGLICIAVLSGASSRTPSLHAAPKSIPNDNRSPAGTKRNDTLTVALEARRAMWYPNGDSSQGREVEAFAEEGRAPLVP